VPQDRTGESPKRDVIVHRSLLGSATSLQSASSSEFESAEALHEHLQREGGSVGSPNPMGECNFGLTKLVSCRTPMDVCVVFLVLQKLDLCRRCELASPTHSG
jgi:hypothetical protein